MGLTYANIELRNALDSRLPPIRVRALADTGALTLCIPQSLSDQLGLQQVQLKEAITADGQCLVRPYVGPIEITFGDRSCFAGALVLGDEVLLGAVPMGELDLVVYPATKTIAINPINTDLAPRVDAPP